MEESYDNRFELFRKWLLIVSIFISLFGLAMALLKDSLLSFIFEGLFDPLFWPQGLTDEGTGRFKNFAVSLLGATMVMWGIAFFGIIKYAFAKRAPWAWNTLLYSTLAWFVIDESFSIYYQVWVNAVGNLPLLIFLLLPLIMTREFFH